MSGSRVGPGRCGFLDYFGSGAPAASFPGARLSCASDGAPASSINHCDPIGSSLTGPGHTPVCRDGSSTRKERGALDYCNS